MNHKMEKQEYKDEYAKRSSVEGPFGIFKEQFQLEKEIVIGMIKTEERINLDALAYNLIRLYNIKQEIENTTGEIEKTEARNQLRPIEAEIDEMVNKLYGIEAKEEIVLDELEEEVLITDETEEDED